jgi:hypothetical protein
VLTVTYVRIIWSHSTPHPPLPRRPFIRLPFDRVKLWLCLPLLQNCGHISDGSAFRFRVAALCQGSFDVYEINLWLNQHTEQNPPWKYVSLRWCLKPKILVTYSWKANADCVRSLLNQVHIQCPLLKKNFVTFSRLRWQRSVSVFSCCLRFLLVSYFPRIPLVLSPLLW